MSDRLPNPPPTKGGGRPLPLGGRESGRGHDVELQHKKKPNLALLVPTVALGATFWNA